MIKNEKEITKNKSYILQFIDSVRFMASSLSNLVNNLFEGIHKINCEHEHDDQKGETCKLSISIATVFLNTQTLKMN